MLRDFNMSRRSHSVSGIMSVLVALALFSIQSFGQVWVDTNTPDFKRHSLGMAYDAARRVMVSFGGLCP